MRNFMDHIKIVVCLAIINWICSVFCGEQLLYSCSILLWSVKTHVLFFRQMAAHTFLLILYWLYSCYMLYGLTLLTQAQLNLQNDVLFRTKYGNARNWMKILFFKVLRTLYRLSNYIGGDINDSGKWLSSSTCTGEVSLHKPWHEFAPVRPNCCRYFCAQTLLRKYVSKQSLHTIVRQYTKQTFC